LDVFRSRPLDGRYPYLWLDANVERVRDPGGVRQKALVVAYSVHAGGRREVLGIDVGDRKPLPVESGKRLVGRECHGSAWRRVVGPPAISAVVFDLDGVIVDSEAVWFEIRRAYSASFGLTWSEDDQMNIIGYSSSEWSRYMRENSRIPRIEPQIVDDLVDLAIRRFESDLPRIDGAVELVHELARFFKVAVASSAPLTVIEWTLDRLGLTGEFRVRVSSDEVPRGKPEPDVYVEACRRLGAPVQRSVAIEDSANGILSAKAAGLAVIAVPNPRFPPPAHVLLQADCTLERVAGVNREIVNSLAHDE
jgi:HAD superfamily hydrolase (TIGR01509 family)